LGSVNRKGLRHLFAACIAAFASLAFLAAAAQAGPLVASAPACSSGGSQVFQPWLDPAGYVLDAGGAFEDGGAGWSLDGASVVSGNEPYNVHGSGESHSLSLPAASSATSATACVGIENPDIRLFARNSGSALSTLKVEVLFEDAGGNVLSAPIGAVANTGGWQPTLAMPIVVNLLPLLPGDHTPVAFRFTPQGAGGNWRIDDVYVDPWANH